jgi:probable rRNA maturation factor
MSTLITCDDFCLTSEEVENLAVATYKSRSCKDQKVAIKCVSKKEINRLNKQYRKKDNVTNVLTFSYGDEEHDVALCLAVAKREASERKIELRDYVALLLVHAFLHVCGMDHERSSEEQEEMEREEKKILSETGIFKSYSL